MVKFGKKKKKKIKPHKHKCDHGPNYKCNSCGGCYPCLHQLDRAGLTPKWVCPARS